MVWLYLVIGIGAAVGTYFFLSEIEKKAKEAGFPVNKEMILGGGLLVGSYFLKQADLKEPAQIMGLAGAGLAGYGVYKYLKESGEISAERKWQEAYRTITEEQLNPALPEEVRKKLETEKPGFIKPDIRVLEVKKERFKTCLMPGVGIEQEKNVIKLRITPLVAGGYYPETIYHLHIHSKMIDYLVYVYHPTDGVLFNAYEKDYICSLPYQKGRLYFNKVRGIVDIGVIELYGLPIDKSAEIHFSIKGCAKFPFVGWKCPLSEDKLHVRTWTDNVYINCCKYSFSEILSACQAYAVDIYDRIRYPTRGTCSKECVKCFEDKNKICIDENPDWDLVKCETEEVEVL